MGTGTLLDQVMKEGLSVAETHKQMERAEMGPKYHGSGWCLLELHRELRNSCFFTIRFKQEGKLSSSQ